MTHMRTQTSDYWTSPDFKLSQGDIEQIYNYLISVEEPQPIENLARVVIQYRVDEEVNQLKRRLQGRTVYQPSRPYAVGDALVFPNLDFAQGEVTAARDAQNPQYGTFKAIEVTFSKDDVREFAAELDIEHPLNRSNGESWVQTETPEVEDLYARHGATMSQLLADQLGEQEEFIRLGHLWFVKGLLAEINVGHLHLSEAVLEVNGGGPLPTTEILVHLEMDNKIPQSVQAFSLNYALLNDERFDEVAPPDRVAWFLRRMAPAAVRETPERLVYESISFDRALLGSRLLQMERELDDEWSDLASAGLVQPVKLTLIYPHRTAGTLPLSSRVRPLFPLGISQRQLVTLIDDESGQEMPCWVVAEGRYIYGLESWYEENGIPVGAFINLTPTGEVGRVQIGIDRRPKERKEYLRLAHVEGKKLRFELQQRNIGCDYDELMILGTDQAAAVDVIFRQVNNQRWSLSSILAAIMPDLSQEGTLNAVHARTLYSAVNVLLRVPPGVVFAELVRHPAFVSVGDQYWQFDPNKWQG